MVDPTARPLRLAVFSTDMLPEPNRFDAFVEEFARKIVRLDVRRLGDAPFRARLCALDLGPVICKSVDYSPSAFGRTAHLTSDGNDDFLFHICQASPYRDTLRDKVVEQGEGNLVNNAHPSFVASNTDGTALSVVIPRKLLMPLVPDTEDLARTAIAHDSLEMRLLRNYLVALLGAPSANPATAEAVGRHVLDLVALVLGAGADVAHEATQNGLRAARWLALRQSIVARLSNSDVSLSSIAAINGMSKRHVQRMFEDAGTSFSDFVLDQRLRLAHHQLTNPLYRHRRISDIALDAGFGDLSNFNRSFRRRYGMTPSDARAARSQQAAGD